MSEGGKELKGFCSGAEVGIFGIRDTNLILTRCAVEARHVDDAVAIRKRQILEEESVGYREDHGVRANSEGQSENGDGGETGRFAEHAETETEIMKQIVDPIYVSCIAAGFLGLFEATEFAKSGVASFFGR